MQDQFLTSSEVWEQFRITEGTLRAWRKAGHIRAYKFGPRVVRYSMVDLEAFIAASAMDQPGAAS